MPLIATKWPGAMSVSPGGAEVQNGYHRHTAAQPWGTEMKPVLLSASLPQRAR